MPHLFFWGFRFWWLYIPCYRFHIFDKPIFEEYISYVEGAPHLSQSCLHVVQDSLLPMVKKMHPSFENLKISNILGLHPKLAFFFGQGGEAMVDC